MSLAANNLIAKPRKRPRLYTRHRFSSPFNCPNPTSRDRGPGGARMQLANSVVLRRWLVGFCMLLECSSATPVPQSQDKREAQARPLTHGSQSQPGMWRPRRHAHRYEHAPWMEEYKIFCNCHLCMATAGQQQCSVNGRQEHRKAEPNSRASQCAGIHVGMAPELRRPYASAFLTAEHSDRSL